MVDQKINVPKNKVVYLGSLDATIIERTNDNQSRAGGVLPLIDQAVTGYSGGTFITEVTNDLEADRVILKDKFPSINGQEIIPFILKDPDEFNLSRKATQSTIK